MQQHQTSSPQPLVVTNSPSLTLIKPILLPYCREKKLDDLAALRSSKYHVRNLKKMRFYQSDTRCPPWNKALISFTNTAKAQSSLSTLHYQLFGEFNFNTTLFAKEFRGLSSLHSLKLQVREESRDATHIQAFMKTLTCFKNLAHFDVSFSVYKTTRSPALEDLFESLAKLPKLTSLSLHIYLGRSVVGGELDLLASCLTRLTKLCSLKLNIDKCLETGDKNLVAILPCALAKWTNLSHIELSLVGKTIQAPALLKLFKFLGTMKTLSSFTTDLSWSNIAPENNSEILPDYLNCLDPSRIQKLNLSVPVPNQDELPQALMRFSCLKVLHLNFGNRQIFADENIKGICSMLGSLTALESFSINFYSLENDILFDSVVSGIASLQNLKFLKLYFGQLKTISGKQVQQLFESLKPSLKFLDISISEPRSVLNLQENYDNLGENLKQLVNLKNLSLNLGRNDIIKNAEIKSILDSVKELQSLTSLDLRLGDLDDIDESTIEKLSEALKSLPSLSSVHFQLNRCKKLREKQDSLLSLLSILKEKESIIDIYLALSYNQTNQELTEKLWRVKDIYLVWC